MTGLLMRTVPAGGSVTRDAGTCRTTRHGDGPGWPSPVGCGGVRSRHPRARVQPAHRGHEPAAAVSRTAIEPAPVVGRDLCSGGHAGPVLRGVFRCLSAAVTPV